MQKYLSNALNQIAALGLLTFMTSVVIAQPALPSASKQSQQQSFARLQRLVDEEALRNLTYSYGRGNDAIAIKHGDPAKARKNGFDEYVKGMTSDVKIEVYALGSDTPFNTTTGIPAWVDFVAKYFDTQRYTSSIHLMSNFSIEFINANTASVSSYAIVPHFIRSAAKDKAATDGNVEFMNCRYKFEAKRQNDGSWKTTKLRIELQEIWRGVGFFPGGQGAGL
jgi:hypothetical protein